MPESSVPDTTGRLPGPPSDRGHRGRLIAAVIGGLAAVALAGWIIVHLRTDDGPGNAPDGRRVTVVGSGTIVAPPD
jgi:hypothetical protein